MQRVRVGGIIQRQGGGRSWLNNLEGWVHTAEGRYPAAIDALEKAYALSGERDYDSLAHLAVAHARAGRPEACRSILNSMESRSDAGEYVSPFFLSHPYLALGDGESALELVETAYTERDGNLVWNLPDPILDPLRSHPRFARVCESLNVEHWIR